MLVVQNLGVKRIIPTNENVMRGRRKKKRKCDVNNKTDLQVQNVVDKNNLLDTEVSTDIMSSSSAAASNSKIIGIEIDPQKIAKARLLH